MTHSRMPRKNFGPNPNRNIHRTPTDNASQASTSLGQPNTGEHKDVFAGSGSPTVNQSFKPTDIVSAPSGFPKANCPVALAVKPMVDSNRLQRNAQEFGNKTANLMELNTLLENQEGGLDKVVIPKFFGIDNA